MRICNSQSVGSLGSLPQPGRSEQSEFFGQLVLAGEIAFLPSLDQCEVEVVGAMMSMDDQTKVGVAAAAFRLQRLPGFANGAAEFFGTVRQGFTGHKTGCRRFLRTDS